jgi:hypothetical protein
MNSQVTSVKKKRKNREEHSHIEGKDAGTRRPELPPHALEKTYRYNMVAHS